MYGPESRVSLIPSLLMVSKNKIVGSVKKGKKNSWNKVSRQTFGRIENFRFVVYVQHSVRNTGTTHIRTYMHVLSKKKSQKKNNNLENFIF